jgi:UDP-N-acetylmuramoylalanine--D-glutamate ligase
MKRLVILGGGESGAGTAVLAKKQGYDVFLSDKGILKDKYKEELEAHGVAYEEEKHTDELILNADEVVKSPGIPNTARLVKELQAKGIPVISELEFDCYYWK